jgi:hypothetical protein
MFVGSDMVLGADDPMSELFSGTDYSIMGTDYEIMGQAQGADNASARQLALARAAGGVVVQGKAVRREYTQILPFSFENIAAGATQVITIQPQRPFRPEYFRCSSTFTAPFFVINQYTVGQDNQFVASGDVPCDVFSEVSLYNAIKGYTANLGTLIIMGVRNIDSQTRSFRAAFFGTSLSQ